MLQAKVRHVVAQAVQKMIVAVVLRSEKRARLRDQILVVLPDIGGRVERGGAVGGDIHLDWRRLPRVQRNYLQILSGNDGSIDQHGQGNRLECDLALVFQLIAGFGRNRQ